MGKATPEKRVLVDGFPIDTDAPEEVIATIERKIAEGSTGHYVGITDTTSMHYAHAVKSHGDYIKGADFSLCDGIGVKIAARADGKHVFRYNGPMLQVDASRYGASRGWRHYYLGGKDGAAAEMGRRLQEEFPGMVIVGIHEPPFRPFTPEERAAVIADIKASTPDIVWVGIGLLKQEAMIADLIDEVDVPWMIGVGGAFDWHSGRVPRAPQFVRNIGMEWLFRLAVQPRMRVRRHAKAFSWMFAAIGRSIAARISGSKKQVGS